MLKRKLKWQFCIMIISILFLGGSIIFYGSRFIKYYSEAQKSIGNKDDQSLFAVSKRSNRDKDTFSNIRGEYYFTGDKSENYVLFSNQLFRIINFNHDGSAKLITNDIISNLAYESDNFLESNIAAWLNKSGEENTGIYHDSLDENYLTTTETCTDVIDDIKNSICEKKDDTLIVTIPSIYDYVNTGAKNSFIGNKQNVALSSMNTKDEVWSTGTNGTLVNNTNDTILGIKPVITIKAGTGVISGKGTKDDPYIISEKKDMSPFDYVKLGNDTWRIGKIKDGIVKLVKNDVLSNVEIKYASTSTTYSQTTTGSLAYYLNNTYYNSLSYKNKLIECSWYNGSYTNSKSSSYKNAYSTLVKAKVGIPNIADFIMNKYESDYATMTSANIESDTMFEIMTEGGVYGKKITNTFGVVPSICVEQEILTKGNGTKSSPYIME